MNRTFHHKLSAQAIAAVAVIATCALWCLLTRSGLTPLIGLACMLVGAAAVDRMIHTTYVFTPDGYLRITRGRLGGSTSIPVDDIISTRKVRGTLFTAPHIVIEYGAGHYTSAQPTDPDSFIKEIERRTK